MKKSRFTEPHILAILKQGESGVPVPDLCREHGIVRLDMFGSAARADFDPARSDVDLVVDFAPDRTPGIAFFGLHRQFEAILGRPVDLLTRAMLDDRIRDSALNGAVTLYDAA